MPDAVSMSNRAGAPEWLLDTALVGMAIFVSAGFALDSSSGFVFGLAVHVFASLYHGRFGRFRTLTWAMLFLGLTVSFLTGFLGYVLSWGQITFWMAAHLGPDASRVWEHMTMLAPATGAVVAAAAVLDVLALHGPRLRTSGVAQLVAVSMALVVVALIVRDVMHLMTETAARTPPAQEVAIVPPIGFLPVYSLLRAGPTKGLGVALPPLLAVLAALWPWRHAWRFHAARMRLSFTVLWLVAGVGWIGLGLLGTQLADPAVIIASQALALYELVFLAAVPFVLARFLRPVDDERAEVF